jgi:hypothetical protein
MWLAGIVGAIVALAGVEFYALHKYGRVGAPPVAATTATAPAKSTPGHRCARPDRAAAAAPPPRAGSTSRSPRASSAQARAERLGARRRTASRASRCASTTASYQAKYGTTREDVAKVEAGFPDNPNGGFTFEGDFADLSPMRHDVTSSRSRRTAARRCSRAAA